MVFPSSYLHWPDINSAVTWFSHLRIYIDWTLTQQLNGVAYSYTRSVFMCAYNTFIPSASLHKYDPIIRTLFVMQSKSRDVWREDDLSAYIVLKKVSPEPAWMPVYDVFSNLLFFYSLLYFCSSEMVVSSITDLTVIRVFHINIENLLVAPPYGVYHIPQNVTLRQMRCSFLLVHCLKTLCIL